MLSEILIVCLLALVNGFFAMSEMAIVASRKSRLKQMARESRRARTALKLAEAPDHFLSTVQVGITLVILATGAAAGDALGDHFAELIHGDRPGVFAPYAHVLGWLCGFVLSAFVQIVIGELVPKRAALAAPEKIACVIAMPMQVLSRICLPFVWLVNFCSTSILRLIGLHRVSREAATEEEIRMLVAESAEQGVLDADERNMVSRVLRLGDRTVDGVMTPRKRIAWLDITADRDENLQVMRDTPYSRYPVYRGGEADVVGVVEVKRLLRHVAEGSQDLFSHMVKPLFVPATARALDLLESFREAETSLALVVDEYGDIEGMVTINNLLTAVIGATAPADDDSTRVGPIVRRADGSYLVDGALPADDLRELLETHHLPHEAEHEYRTVGGMMVAQFGHIPAVGESFEWEGNVFEVLDLDGARIDKVLVTVAPDEGDDNTG
jgi:putative hemolysin